MKFTLHHSPTPPPASIGQIRHAAMELGYALRDHIHTTMAMGEDVRISLEGLEATGLAAEPLQALETDLGATADLAQHLPSLTHQLIAIETAPPHQAGQLAADFLRWAKPICGAATESPAPFLSHVPELTGMLQAPGLTGRQLSGGHAILDLLPHAMDAVSRTSDALHARYKEILPVIESAGRQFKR